MTKQQQAVADERDAAMAQLQHECMFALSGSAELVQAFDRAAAAIIRAEVAS